jgi:lysophospholipase L1-like esterase
LVSIILALILAEQTLRLLDFDVSPLQIDVGNPNDARKWLPFNVDYFVYDPRLIWRPKPGFGVFNSQGFRGPLLTRVKNAEEFRIFTVGDSNTLGYNNEKDRHGANWPEELQSILKSRRPLLTVTNAAAYGYSSYQGVLRFQECLAYQPDLALVSFGVNDAQQVHFSDREFARAKVRWPTLSRFLRSYRVGRLAWMSFSHFTKPQQQLKPRVSLEEYRQNLTDIIRLGKQHNIQVVLLTRPYRGRLSESQARNDQTHHYNQAVIEVAYREDIAVVDLYSHFKGQEDSFADEAHFTFEGHRIAAELIAEDLSPYLR